MGADKNSSRRRWKLQQGEHGFQHTTPTHYPSWPSPRSHWSAIGPRNQHTTFRPENAADHQTSSPLTNTGQTGEHHRLDRSLLVKLGDFHRKALSYGPPWAHYLSGYQDRLLDGPLGLPGLRYTAPEGVEHKDCRGEVLG
jgi:hypothetical protein